MKYFARENQELSIHLENTANLTKDFARFFDCENLGYSIGILHDLGKYTDTFQDYLQRAIRGEKTIRGEIIHSLQGAKFVAEKISDTLIADILGNIIAAHHNGLFDTINDGERTLTIKTNKSEDILHYDEAIKNFCPNIDTQKIENEIRNFCKKCIDKKLMPLFMMHLLTKILYSCLVDADRCDAAEIKPNDDKPNWDSLIEKLQNYLERIDKKSILDTIRKQISEQCGIAGIERKPGIYTLSVPTGGGKTLSSLQFALKHAKENNMKRIIYVIPYLSILDQTANTIRKVFENEKIEEIILEHHSNIDLAETDDDADEKYRLLTSRWDSPIILTTMTQFLETIYSNRASKLRKFHNMSDSVLIFDEIQALPIKCVHLFNDAVNFLNIFGKSTILLCTATQPHLHNTERPVLLSDNPDIIRLSQDELKNFERVQIKNESQISMDYEQIADLAHSKIRQGESTLIILNTKSDARKVYEKCKVFDCEKAFLTTDLCPAHRLNILERIKTNLLQDTKKITLCVSTQLIEAGVDISFDCVIRAQAGLDSIIQAAGRCNRNKEKSNLQPVIVIDVKDENLSRLPEIKESKSITARVFRDNQDKNLLSAEVIDQFYRYYFYEQKNKMDYSIQNNSLTIYSLLNDNISDAVAYRNRHEKIYTGLPCAFKTAAENFSVIDGAQTGIVVPYGEAEQLIDDFIKAFSPKEKMRILKKLQRYTVSVYSHTLAQISHAISIVEKTFYVLNQDYYDNEEFGLLLNPKLSVLIL